MITADNKNNNKDCDMGSIDLIALVKYAWAAIPPFMWKAWSLIDMRFKDMENDVKEVKKDLGRIETDGKVLVERSITQEKRLDVISEKLDKIYEILLNSNK